MSKVTSEEAPVAKATVQTPAVGWINKMTRFDGSVVAEGAYVLRATTDLTLKAGDTLAVFQVKGRDSYVVKARIQKQAQG